MDQIDLNWAENLTPKSMAHTQSNKLITLGNLADYNHNLITALGLTNDTAGYLYTKSTVVFPNKATTVKGALDQLYDLVATALKNTYAFNSGYKTAGDGESQQSNVQFKKKTDGASASTECYYINVTDGNGNVTNIEFDAEDLVKDGMLVLTRLVYNTTNSLSQVWVEDKGMVADTLPSTASLTKDPEHPYTFIELVTKKPKDPDAEQEFDYVFIKAEDLIGDLVAGDGINKSGLTLSVNISPTGGLKFDETKLAVKLDTQDAYVPLSVSATGIKTTTALNAIKTDGTYKTGAKSPYADGQAKDDVVDNYSSIIGKCQVDSSTELTFVEADPSKSALATTKQVVNTANILQKEIESLKNAGKNTKGNGTVTYGGEGNANSLTAAVNEKYATDIAAETAISYSLDTDDAVIVVSKKEKSGVESFDVVTVVANTSDINALFKAD